MNGNLFDPPASSSAPAEWFTAHCDGGSRGNPGPSGYGAVVEDPRGRVVAQLSEFLGIQTNNYAEYSGLLAVLAWAIENGAKHLRVISDSELMVKQIQGKYSVKEARKRVRRIEHFEIRHTLRGGNKAADELANQAMDRGMGKSSGQPASAVSGSSGTSAPAARPYGNLVTTPIPRLAPLPTAKPARQVLEGYVKDGVVHLLGGELPDGIFVKIIRE
jgi:probable phosphoglycerate mutase